MEEKTMTMAASASRWLAAWLAIGALAGCTAEADDEQAGLGETNASPEQGGEAFTPADDSALASRSAALGSDVYGTVYWGGRGPKYDDIPLGAVIDAVQVRSGSRIDAIRFAWYIPEHADNIYRGEHWEWTPWYGGTGGTERPVFNCPQGMLINGFSMNYSTRMNSLKVKCGDASSPDPEGAAAWSPMWGTVRPNGNEVWNYVHWSCTEGYLSGGFNVGADSRTVLGLQMWCISAQ